MYLRFHFFGTNKTLISFMCELTICSLLSELQLDITPERDSLSHARTLELSPTISAHC